MRKIKRAMVEVMEEVMEEAMESINCKGKKASPLSFNSLCLRLESLDPE